LLVERPGQRQHLQRERQLSDSLGEPIPVGPMLSLKALLAYNSSIWTTWQIQRTPASCGRDCNPFPRPDPGGDRVVGAGWQLHFGRVIPVRTKMFTDIDPSSGATVVTVAATSTSFAPVGMISTGWAFQEPDGSVHEFFDRLVESNSEVAQYTWACPTNANEKSGNHCYGYTHDGSF